MIPVAVYYYNENLQTEEVREILINPQLIVSIAEDQYDENYTEVAMCGNMYYYVAMPVDVFLSYLETQVHNRGLQ